MVQLLVIRKPQRTGFAEVVRLGRQTPIGAAELAKPAGNLIEAACDGQGELQKLASSAAHGPANFVPHWWN